MNWFRVKIFKGKFLVSVDIKPPCRYHGDWCSINNYNGDNTCSV